MFGQGLVQACFGSAAAAATVACAHTPSTHPSITIDARTPQSDRHNLHLFAGLMCGQIHYPSLARDMFVRMHDGHVSKRASERASRVI